MKPTFGTASVVFLLSIQASQGVVYTEVDALTAAEVPNAVMTHVTCNNLNNQGPSTCYNGATAETCSCGTLPNTIRYSEFSDYKGQTLDLVVTAKNANYACEAAQCSQNGNPNAGTGANFGKVNMAAPVGSQADLAFQIYQTGTTTPVIVDYFNLAITDLDGSPTVLNAESVAIDPAATVAISEKQPPGEVTRSSNVYTSTTANVAGDNPTTPPTMTAHQLSRTVIVQMENTDHSDNTFTNNGGTSRSVMFNAEVLWPELPPDWITTTTTEMKFGLPWWFWLLLCLLLCCCCFFCCGLGGIPFLTKKKPKPTKELTPTVIEEVITEEDEPLTGAVPMASMTVPTGSVPMASMSVPVGSIPQAY